MTALQIIIIILSKIRKQLRNSSYILVLIVYRYHLGIDLEVNSSDSSEVTLNSKFKYT